MVLTFSTTELELGSWQSPFVYDPHFPVGVPKLANLTADISVFSGHFKWTVGLFLVLSLPSLCQDSGAMDGWSSATCAHRALVLRFEKVIFDGSPPFSSKITRTFPEGLNQERGTWYLVEKDVLILMSSGNTEVTNFITRLSQETRETQQTSSMSLKLLS